MNNNESNHSGWIFLAGLATGAAIGYLINSDRGRQVRSDAAHKAVELSEQARSMAQSKLSSVAGTVSSILEQGKAYAAEVSNKLQEKIGSASGAAQEGVQKAESAFERGAEKAKAQMHAATN